MSEKRINNLRHKLELRFKVEFKYVNYSTPDLYFLRYLFTST